MRRDELLEALRDLAPDLKDLGVGRLFLFGSAARDAADAMSDIDLLVDPAHERFSIFDLALVKNRLEAALSATVDPHDYGGYVRLPAFRARVEPDLICVF